jgi:DNA-directed RNA polymerase specialized sigma24 family protein
MKKPQVAAVPLTTSLDDGLSAFLNMRPRLFGIAYRMLGSAAEAEDIVQDVWVRWQTTDRSVVRDAAAFLATTATRLAINVRQSARSRRETDVGHWLSEPVDPSADPGVGAERGEGLAAVSLRRMSSRPRTAAGWCTPSDLPSSVGACRHVHCRTFVARMVSQRIFASGQ